MSGRHGQIVAAERGAEHALGRLEDGRNQHAANREAVGHALGHGDDVGQNAGRFVGEEAARAAVSALDLIQNQHRAVLGAQAAQLLQESGLRDVDAAHALYALDDDARHVALGQLALHGLGIVQVHEGDALPCVERRHDFRIVRHRHRARRAPVEALAEGHHTVAAGVERCQLDGVLVGLGARVDKEQRIVVEPGHLPYLARQFHLHRVSDAVGIEADSAQLLGDCRHVFRMAVSDRNDGMAAVEVKIFLTVFVPDLAPQSLDRSDVEKGIYVEEIHSVVFLCPDVKIRTV